MSVISHLIDLFSNTAGITSKIGAGSACRVYPLELPQGVTYPCVRLSYVTGERHKTLEGQDGLGNVRVQIDCFAQTFTELDSKTDGLVAAIRAALKDYSGTRKGQRIEHTTEIYAPSFPEPEVKAKRMSVDWIFRIRD